MTSRRLQNLSDGSIVQHRYQLCSWQTDGLYERTAKKQKMSTSAETCFTNVGKSVCKRVCRFTDMHTLLKGDDLTSQIYRNTSAFRHSDIWIKRDAARLWSWDDYALLCMCEYSMHVCARPVASVWFAPVGLSINSNAMFICKGGGLSLDRWMSCWSPPACSMQQAVR